MLIHTLAQWLAYVASLKPTPTVPKNALMSPWWPGHPMHGPYAAGIGVPKNDVLLFALLVVALLAVVILTIRRGLHAARRHRLN